MTRPRSRAAGVSARSTPAEARVDPLEARRAGQQPIERVGRQPAAEQHLDVVDRTVGQALDRDASRAAPRARRPGSARGRASGSAPTGSGVRAIAVGAPPGPLPGPAAGRGRSVALIGGHRLAGASSMTRAIQRSGSSISPSRGSVSGPSHSRRSAAGPPASAMARTNALALLVLLHLQVHAGQPEHRPLERRPARRAARGTAR